LVNSIIDLSKHYHNKKMIKQIILEIKLILSENFGIDECRLTDNFSGSILLMDMEDHIEFIRRLEKRFHLRINSYDSEDIYTVKDAVKYVYERINEIPDNSKRKWYQFFN